MNVRSTVRPAVATVQAVARGTATPPVRRTRRTGGRSGRVALVRVDPRVMAVARRLAEGDMSRLRIESETEVVVRNPRR